ncbi:MAG: hypothetical protein ACKO6N_21750 [Myxococcota bacterium]
MPGPLTTRSAASFLRSSLGLGLGVLLLTASACSDKKPEQAAQPAAGSQSMKNVLDQKGGPLPAPPSENAAPPAGGPPGGGADPNAFTSPECKGFEEEQKTIRAEVDRINTEQVAPASDKAEAASDDFQACQDDAGCLSDLARFQAKQSALASARRAQEAAEKQVEDLETKLHDISQKMAAKCNNDPL